MEQMRKVILAAFLGIVIGAVIGYSPLAQPASAPRALLIGQAAQTNVVPPTPQPATAADPEPLLIAMLAGLVIALPVFLLARRRSS